MRAILNGYFRLLQILLGVLIAVLLVPVSLQIIARYTGFVPRYIWTEELARFCFIWIVLVGAMIAVREGTHFTVDFLPHPKSPKLEAISRMVADSFVLAVAMVFVVWGWPLVKFGLAQTSEMAELPMVYIYSAWPIAGITSIVFLVERFIDHVRLYRSAA